MASLFHGLVNDNCHAPHWGYVISGDLVVDYTDGSHDTCTSGDLFHWPPGHSVKATGDAEVILFSPNIRCIDLGSPMRGQYCVEGKLDQ